MQNKADSLPTFVDKTVNVNSVKRSIKGSFSSLFTAQSCQVSVKVKEKKSRSYRKTPSRRSPCITRLLFTIARRVYAAHWRCARRSPVSLHANQRHAASLTTIIHHCSANHLNYEFGFHTISIRWVHQTQTEIKTIIVVSVVLQWTLLTRNRDTRLYSPITR